MQDGAPLASDLKKDANAKSHSRKRTSDELADVQQPTPWWVRCGPLVPVVQIIPGCLP